MIKPILKQFPFIYPPRFIGSCREWIDRRNRKSGLYAGARQHSYELLEPAEHHTFPLPELADPADTAKFSNNLFYTTAAAYLFSLKDVYTYRQSGLVFSNRNALFLEFTHHFGISSLSRFILKKPFYTYGYPIKNIPGISALLLSPQSQNYYHWLFDVLPRIKLYQPVMGHIRYFCISSAVPEKFLAVLPLFGITADRLLLVSDAEKLHFDSLYVSSLPGSEGRSPRWGIQFVRSVLLGNQAAPLKHKKLYLNRGAKAGRGILNEESLIRLLEKQGFEIIEPDELTIAQQITLTRQAEIVVGAHGAALSNILFAQEGTRVIEFFPPDYFRTDCYFTLARLLKLDYQYLKGSKPAGANWGEMLVDEHAVIRLLENPAPTSR